MERVQKSIEIDRPLSMVYNQWTQFEEFPRFMDGVEEVHQIDDTTLHWRITIAGLEREYDAKIIEQVPDQRIAWVNIDGPTHGGIVEFSSLPNNRTLLTLTIEYQPEGLVEKMGDLMGATDRRAEGDLKNFKEYIESLDRETGAWRGKIEGGREQAA